MPIASGGYTRPSNSFSNPTFGAAVDPDDADELFDDIETAVSDLVKGTGKVATVNASTASITLDASTARHFIVNLQTNVSTVTLSNWPSNGALVRVTVEIRNTGSYTYAHPSDVLWPDGVAPSVTSGNGKIDWFAYLSADGGTTKTGHVLGLDFS